MYGTTRNPEGASGRKLQAKGVTPLKGDFKDPASLVEALRTSGAKRVWFMTDFWGKDGGSRAKELAQVLDRVGVVENEGGSMGLGDSERAQPQVISTPKPTPTSNTHANNPHPGSCGR